MSILHSIKASLYDLQLTKDLNDLTAKVHARCNAGGVHGVMCSDDMASYILQGHISTLPIRKRQ